jgi:hypothetical protein
MSSVKAGLVGKLDLYDSDLMNQRRICSSQIRE